MNERSVTQALKIFISIPIADSSEDQYVVFSIADTSDLRVFDVLSKHREIKDPLNAGVRSKWLWSGNPLDFANFAERPRSRIQRKTEEDQVFKMPKVDRPSSCRLIVSFHRSQGLSAVRKWPTCSRYKVFVEACNPSIHGVRRCA